jgi:hypothetical protein
MVSMPAPIIVLSRLRRAFPAVVPALVIAALAPAAAHAKAGAVDRSFADHGLFSSWAEPRQPWGSPLQAWPGGRGRTVIASAGLRRLDARGRADATFGTAGAVTFPQPWAALTRMPGGAWIVGRPEPYQPVALLDLDGHAAVTSDAFAATARAVAGQHYDVFAPLADGTALDIHEQPKGGSWTVTKIALNGQVIGTSAAEALGNPLQSIASGDGAVVATAYGLLRLRADGSLDPGWGRRPDRLVPLSDDVSAMAPWDRGGAVVLTYDSFREFHRLRWIDRRGRVVRALRLPHDPWEVGRLRFTYALSTDAQGRTLLGRAYDANHALSVTRLRRDGRTDRTFGRRGVIHLRTSRPVDIASLAVQPDGRIMVVASLLLWGPQYQDREDVPTPGYGAHGTAVWRLLAR